MRVGFFLAAVFAWCFLIETSFLHAFGGMVAYIPLITIAGIIVMQRFGIEEGVLWFVSVAVLRGDIFSLVFALIGPMLVQQIFTTRSVYALLGFGAVGYTVSSVVALACSWGLDTLFHTAFLLPHPFERMLIIGALLIPGLFFGTLFLRLGERYFLSRIRFRQPS